MAYHYLHVPSLHFVRGYKGSSIRALGAVFTILIKKQDYELLICTDLRMNY